MDATTIAWALGAATATGLAVRAAASAVWASEKAAQHELITSLKAQALSSETRAIASDQARERLQSRYDKLVGEFKVNVVALNKASVWADPGALIGSVPPPPGVDEPTGIYMAEGRRARSVILDDREELERARQQPLNPEAERRERERVDRLTRQYALEEDERRRRERSRR